MRSAPSISFRGCFLSVPGDVKLGLSKKKKKNRSRGYIGSLAPGILYEWDKIDAQCNVDWIPLSEALLIICH